MIDQATLDCKDTATDTANTLLFTAEELRILVMHPGDIAVEAIRAGDHARARELCRDSRNMHRALFGNYALWNMRSLTYIAKEYGLPVFHEALSKSIEPWLRPIAETFRNGVTREAVASIAQIWRKFCVEFGPVEETESTIVFQLNGCGPLYTEDQTGQPPEPRISRSLAQMRNAGGADPQVPLMTATILHGEALMTGWLGYPPFVVDFRSDGAPDLLTIFKDPMQIPAVYFERIERKRDARLIRGAVDVAGGQLFSKTELAELSRHHVDRAIDALDAGDIGAAIGWCQLSKGEWYPAHHILRDWVTGQLGYVYTHYGTDATYNAVWQGYNEATMVPMLAAVETQDLRSQVVGLAGGFCQHAMRFRIEEDADKFVFITEPCGSGGRLIQEGAYQAPKNFPRIRDPHRAGFYQENFPVYCVHCPSTNNQVLERGGPYYLMVDGDLMTVPDGNCNFYIFKNPAAIPDRFFRRAGMQRPANLGPTNQGLANQGLTDQGFGCKSCA